MTPNHWCLTRVMSWSERRPTRKAVRPPVASLLEISEAMRAQEVPPVDWMGGVGFRGGWLGGRCAYIFFDKLGNGCISFLCVFFFCFLWNLCHGWQILFFFVIYVFFCFFLLLWGWEIFVFHILLGSFIKVRCFSFVLELLDDLFDVYEDVSKNCSHLSFFFSGSKKGH